MPASLSFNGSPRRGCELPHDVVFTSTVNPPNNPNNYTYLWDFGDGNTSNAPSPTHSYTNRGNFSVSVTITDSVGCETTTNINNYIQIQNHPTANFSITNPNACLGTPIQFTNTSLAGDTYLWDFGDGHSSTQQHPSHTYISPGNYTVSLTTSNSLIPNCTNTTTASISQNSPISGQATIIDDSCGQNIGAIAINLSGGLPPYTYQWNTGSTLPLITQLPAGIYTLTATDSQGCIFYESFIIEDISSLHIDSLFIEGCSFVAAGDSNHYYPYVVRNTGLADSVSWDISPSSAVHSYLSTQKDTLFLAIVSNQDSSIYVHLTVANDCDTVLIYDTLTVDFDPVLPGDIDQDACISNSDLLLLDHEVMRQFALHASFYSGAIRSNCSDDSTQSWRPEAAYPWANNTWLNPSINTKHLDANGDGIANSGSPYYLPHISPPTNDLEHIMYLQYMNAMNSGTALCPSPLSSIGQPISQDLLHADVLSRSRNGDTTQITVVLKLGQPNDSIGIRGISFSTSVNNGLNEQIVFDYTNSHLGTLHSDMNASNGRLSDSLTVSVLNRLDTRYFSGQIVCELECYIFINPLDRLATNSSASLLSLHDVQIIDAAGNIVTLDSIAIPISFPCGHDAFENNDSIEAAVPIPPYGIRKNAQICPPEDKDWYSFVIDSNKRHIELRLSGLSEDCTLSLFDSGGNMLISTNASGTADEVIRSNSLIPNPYFVEVKASHEKDITTGYLLQLQRRNIPFANNSPIREQLAISHCPSVNGRVCKTQDDAILWSPAQDAFHSTHIEIYPNPSSGTFTLKHISEHEIKTIEVSVMSLNGQIVYQNQFSPTSSTFSQIIDISQEVSGIYFLRIKVDGTEQYYKVIKN